jgi:pimeloyl-ACP methyl ester carboxylesterase
MRRKERVVDGRGRLALSGGEIELLDVPGEDGKPSLVLLHEGLGSVGLWRGFPERLAAATNSRTIAFSRYGHGQSDPPPKPRTPTFMHEEALEVLPELVAKLGIHEPLLVGHSDGASIALIYAAQHPVTAVVAIAPHVFVEDMCLAEIRQTKQTFETTDLRERMGRHHRDPDAAFYGWNDVWLHPEFPQWNIEGELEQIGAPLLLIQGTKDQYGTMAQLDSIEQRANGPVTRVHLDCQHSPPTELPHDTAEAIAAFTSDLPPSDT